MSVDTGDEIVNICAVKLHGVCQFMNYLIFELCFHELPYNFASVIRQEYENLSTVNTNT